VATYSTGIKLREIRGVGLQVVRLTGGNGSCAQCKPRVCADAEMGEAEMGSWEDGQSRFAQVTVKELLAR
jgi:Na+-transporting NADH:ubiquinone oxidoreductase subunit NqrF